MSRHPSQGLVDSRILSLCFFLSGFAGLAYQMIWTRLAYAQFGINVQVLSVVISVFMGGLLLGAVLGAPLARRARRSGVSPLALYAMVETFIGIGALVVPWFFEWGRRALLSSGGLDGATYGVLSALVLAVSILPFCTAMGMTYPVVMTHLFDLRDPGERSTSFSRLYVGNLAGALAGVLLTAFVLVEILGFRGCLRVALAFNLAAAALGAWRSRTAPPSGREALRPAGAGGTVRDAWGFRVLFWTGFCSMGMEVVWTRAFTPVLKTQVYSFASLLAVYMAASALGAALYRRHRARQTVIDPGVMIAVVALTALLPVLLNDPRIHFSAVIVLLSIVPFCGTLGYLTPRLVDDVSQGSPDTAGRAYAVNLAGCILGPLVSGYLLVPMIGAKASLLLLTVPMALLFLVPALAGRRSGASSLGWGMAMMLALLVGGRYTLSFEEYFPGVGGHCLLRRDSTATVVAGGQGMDKLLFVNGVGITSMTTITKYMTHLPLLCLGREPDTSLVICLGMGTSYRSGLSWSRDTKVVELVPSVKALLTFFHPDLAGRAKADDIVVDDGRRYLERIPDRYDAIIIDPPPPAEAAGSSLLYSEEFYAIARRRLNPGGILQQWFPGAGDLETLGAVARSLAKSFRHVLVLPSCERWGFHFLASETPIRVPTLAEAERRMPIAAWKDLSEWKGEAATRSDLARILGQARDISVMLPEDPRIVITDDRPFNEYFLLRRLR